MYSSLVWLFHIRSIRESSFINVTQTGFWTAANFWFLRRFPSSSSFDAFEICRLFILWSEGHGSSRTDWSNLDSSSLDSLLLGLPFSLETFVSSSEVPLDLVTMFDHQSSILVFESLRSFVREDSSITQILRRIDALRRRRSFCSGEIRSVVSSSLIEKSLSSLG